MDKLKLLFDNLDPEGGDRYRIHYFLEVMMEYGHV